MTGDVPSKAANQPSTNAAAGHARATPPSGARVSSLQSLPADPPPVKDQQYVGGAPLSYRDAEGVQWTVVEVSVDRRAVPGARGAHCLFFSRKDCIRRVWEYPADWRVLDSIALTALSWNR